MNVVKNYLRDLLSVHKKVFLWLPDKLEASGKNSTALLIVNAKSYFGKMKHRFFYDEEQKIFYVTEGTRKQYFTNRKRGFHIYKYGLEYRAKQVWDSYLLSIVEFSRSDIVIDCGANYADLWLTLCHKIDAQNYITFEPGKLEFLAISKNAPNSFNNRVGLSNESGTSRFYLNSDDADSSFVEPSKYSGVDEVQITTLDNYIESRSLKNIKLLKLEAEGFEPEILEGAIKSLQNITFVSIDGGYERGVMQEETFSFQTNFLLKNGFEMLGINLASGRALFKKR